VCVDDGNTGRETDVSATDCNQYVEHDNNVADEERNISEVVAELSVRNDAIEEDGNDDVEVNENNNFRNAVEEEEGVARMPAKWRVQEQWPTRWDLDMYWKRNMISTMKILGWKGS
jgi:hypothetical protein